MRSDHGIARFMARSRFVLGLSIGLASMNFDAGAATIAANSWALARGGGGSEMNGSSSDGGAATSASDIFPNSGGNVATTFIEGHSGSPDVAGRSSSIGDGYSRSSFVREILVVNESSTESRLYSLTSPIGAGAVLSELNDGTQGQVSDAQFSWRVNFGGRKAGVLDVKSHADSDGFSARGDARLNIQSSGPAHIFWDNSVLTTELGLLEAGASAMLTISFDLFATTSLGTLRDCAGGLCFVNRPFAISRFGSVEEINQGVDNISFQSISAVPEPGEWAMLLLGLTVISMRRRSQSAAPAP
jgi:hypothetical protein